MDRYSHEIEDDTDDTDDSPVFGLFSSCSPQYRKTHGSKLSLTSDLSSIKSSSLATAEVSSSEPLVSDSKLKLKTPVNVLQETGAVPKSVDSRKVSQALEKNYTYIITPLNLTFRSLWTFHFAL